MIMPLALLTGPSALAAPPRVLEDLELHQTVTLTDAGAEPRAVVRFAPSPGATARYDIITKQDMGLSMTSPDGQVMDLSAMAGNLSPTVIMGMTHEVGQPVADGLVPIQVTTSNVRVEGVPAELRSQMMAGISVVNGLGYRILVGTDGRIAQVDVAADDPAIFEVIQSMADQNLTNNPSFPAEPVGVGASWTVDADMSVSGMDLDVTQTVTVVSLTAETVELDTRFDIRRGDGPLVLPGLPPGAEVEFTKFEGSGKGRMVTDLTTMASTGITTVNVDVGLKAGTGAGGPPMAMDMDMTMTTETRPASK